MVFQGNQKCVDVEKADQSSALGERRTIRSEPAMGSLKAQTGKLRLDETVSGEAQNVLGVGK